MLFRSDVWGAEALRYSMLWSLGLYVVAFIAFGLAAITITREWRAPGHACSGSDVGVEPAVQPQ